MLFGVKLQSEEYAPWKQHYIQYERLKRLLKQPDEDVNGKQSSEWSQKDEEKFVEVLDKNLENVYAFYSKAYNEILDKISRFEEQTHSPDNIDIKQFETDLDSITDEARRLEKFSRINFTGFYKIAKKHDRLHPGYSVKPLLNVRLQALPFYSEDYSPLLYRLSDLYTFARENGAQNSAYSLQPIPSASASASTLGANMGNEVYTSHRFWVHPDNIMEVKTMILRHLPVLIYNPLSDSGETSRADPFLTSLYFDNSDFELYHDDLENKKATSLRLRWYGDLTSKTDILLERKTSVEDDGGSEIVEDQVSFKEKYVQPFLENKYRQEKIVQKMVGRQTPAGQVQKYEDTVAELQTFINNHHLEPVMRAVYSRTAFQIPGDDRLRISLDTNMCFIREDAFNKDYPCRDKNNWHRADIDDNKLHYPFETIRSHEISRFPYGLLEIRTCSSRGHAVRSWVKELMNSHLIKSVPRFSKFLHGVSILFEDDENVDALPYWLTQLDQDIRQKPDEAAAAAGTTSTAESSQNRNHPSSPSKLSLHGSSGGGVKGNGFDNRKLSNVGVTNDLREGEGIVVEDEGDDEDESVGGGQDDYDTDDEEVGSLVRLPPGVKRPTKWLTQKGPLRIEAKVWLANERTFNKWLHIAVLMSAITFAVYNGAIAAAGENNSHTPAEILAYCFFALTLFSGLWGYAIYMKRLDYIKLRSGRHLDAPFGPIVVSIGLLIAMILNFVLRWKQLDSTTTPSPEIVLTSQFN